MVQVRHVWVSVNQGLMAVPVGVACADRFVVVPMVLVVLVLVLVDQGRVRVLMLVL